MMEKWIVTGGCGFCGSNLSASLLADGHEVVVFDSLARQGASTNLAWLRSLEGKLTVVQGDMRCQSDVDDMLARHSNGVHAIAHLAGQVAMTTSLARPRYDFETNVGGAVNLLEAVRRHAPEATLLFSSTNKVYGDLIALRYEETPTRWTLPDYPTGLDETTPLDFCSPYGCSKGAADQYFLDYHRMFGLRTVVFRHSSIYGGRQFATFDQGWVGWFCQEALRQAAEKDGAHTPSAISGDGKQVRDLLHADDLVRCYRLAAASPAAFGKAFNIGGGMENSLSLVELFGLLEQLTGVKFGFQPGSWRASDQRVFVANTRLASETFGFAPSVPKGEGVARMLQWTRDVAQAAGG